MDFSTEWLTETGIKIIVQVIFAAVLAVGTTLVARNWIRRGKVWIGNGAGRTCMSPIMIIIGLLSGAASLAFFLLGVWTPESFQEPGEYYAWAGLVGCFALGLFVMLPCSRYSWEWDYIGLRWRSLRGTRSIRWPNITRVGKSWSGTFYAADKSGQKICWWPLTLEHEALRAAIQAQRPDLFPSDT